MIETSVTVTSANGLTAARKAGIIARTTLTSRGLGAKTFTNQAMFNRRNVMNRQINFKKKSKKKNEYGSTDTSI